jgi:hypothetical protein
MSLMARLARKLPTRTGLQRYNNDYTSLLSGVERQQRDRN